MSLVVVVQVGVMQKTSGGQRLCYLSKLLIDLGSSTMPWQSK